MCLSQLLVALCASVPVSGHIRPSESRMHNTTFDYVVVGGGTAGLTVVNRLSENPQVTVAVIEAGTHANRAVGNLSEVPAYAGTIESVADNKSSVGWGFKTTPQRGLGGTTVGYVRAKVLGGCSVINDMAYSRGNKGGFQLWADTVGDDSFTWDKIEPYYKKSMNFTPPDSATRLANATPYYDIAETAQGGPLDVTYPAGTFPWSTWVSKGLTAIGLPKVGAFIEGKLNGSTYQLLTVSHLNGHRATSDTGFLTPILQRPNLFVFEETLVERIRFDAEKTATGVEASTQNASGNFILHARKGVILSAGVIQSPQLLMVSGIGPAATLVEHNITVINDKPGVGQNLLDHVLIPLTWRVRLDAPNESNTTAIREFDAGQPPFGPLTNPGGDYAGLEKIPASFRANWSAGVTAILEALPSDWPEIEYLVRPFAVSPGTVPGESYASLFCVLQAPQSIGNVTISSASMRDAPVINPNWLTAPADLDVLLAAVKRARGMASSSALKDIVLDEFLPGPAFESNEKLLKYFQSAGTSIHHGHATNKMGKPDDPAAVIGTTGLVYGVKNLRVIDASAFPFLLPGPGPQAHIYMLAEKLADAIKQGG